MSGLYPAALERIVVLTVQSASDIECRMDDPSRALAATLPPGQAREDTVELRKPNEMIVMIPRSKRVTLTGRRIYNALLQVSQARLRAMDSMPAADYMFEAPLPAILKTTGSNGEDRTAAKRYLKEMRGLEVDWGVRRLPATG